MTSFMIVIRMMPKCQSTIHLKKRKGTTTLTLEMTLMLNNKTIKMLLMKLSNNNPVGGFSKECCFDDCQLLFCLKSLTTFIACNKAQSNCFLNFTY